MDLKDIQKQFRVAPWTAPQQVDAWVLACGALPPAEILKLLAMLGEKTIAVDGIPLRNRHVAFRKLVEAAADPSLFVPFVKAMKTADQGLRLLLADILPAVNNQSAHPELAALVKQPEPAVRKAAARVMKAIGGKSIFELSFALAGEEHPGRADAIDLAAQIGGYHSIKALEYAVQSAKPPEKMLALKYLGDPRLMSKNVPGALAAIEKGFKDPIEMVVAQAALAFAGLCSEDEYHTQLAEPFDTASVAIIRSVVEGAKRFPSPRTFTLLEKRFRVGPNSIRMAVLNAAEAIATDDTLPLLVDALSSKNVQIRTRAGEALSSLSVNKKVNLGRTLLWLLRSPDVNVRRMAVDVARKVGDPNGELWPMLLKFLRDEDWWVRERIMDALVDMAGTQLTRHVVGYLQDPSDVVRRYAVDVLIRLKDPGSLGALVRVMMGDTDWWVREKAMEAIGHLKDQRAIPYLVDAMAKVPELRIAAFSALAMLGATTASQAVAGFVSDPDIDVRLAALTCLKTIGDPAVAPLIQPLASETNVKLRQAAHDLLVIWNVKTPDSVGEIAAGFTSLDRLLIALARIEGDDLLLASGRPPYVKRLGKVMALEGVGPIDSEAMESLLLPAFTETQRELLNGMKDIDFSYEVKAEELRFRANVFYQHSGLGAVFRIVKNQLTSLEKLGLPKITQTFGDLRNGLVLVGGPTGSGKSTTLAAIIDYINRTSARHIISLEDPIEVMHERKKSLVNQREIGTHTKSFDRALRSVLREDPDVLLVGEMRDLQTIAFAVTAAETGHLVFGTVHTVSADTTMDRLINSFPAGQQGQVRSMLAESLRAVVCQHLLRRADGIGRVLSVEIMTNNDAISNLIRKGKCFQIPSVIATQREVGMQSMDGELKRLIKEGAITPEEGYMKANNKKDFEEFFPQDATTPAEKPALAPPPAPTTIAVVPGSPARPPSIPSGGPASFAPGRPPPMAGPATMPARANSAANSPVVQRMQPSPPAVNPPRPESTRPVPTSTVRPVPR